MKGTPPSWPPVKYAYHHGDLRKAAIKRGREMVELWGPDALTLRGLARELGVTAPALVYHFGTRQMLRAAVAESVLVDAAAACGVDAMSAAPAKPPEEVGKSWINFAVENQNLYRLASGEGWHLPMSDRNGWGGGSIPVRSPREVLRMAFLCQTRGYGRPHGAPALSDLLASSIHGLALARMDGASAEVVGRALKRASAVTVDAA